MARISSAMLLPSSSAHSCCARGERGRPRFSRLSRVALSIAGLAWARRALIPVTAVYRDDAAAESVVAAALQSRVLHHLHESLRVRMHADRLGQIAVTRRVARHQLAEQRQNAKGVGVVQRFQARDLRVRELEHQQLPAGLEGAAHGGERRALVGDIAQAEADGDAVEAAVGERQTLRSEEHTSELQSRGHLVCRLLLEKKKKN